MEQWQYVEKDARAGKTTLKTFPTKADALRDARKKADDTDIILYRIVDGRNHGVFTAPFYV